MPTHDGYGLDPAARGAWTPAWLFMDPDVPGEALRLYAYLRMRVNNDTMLWRMPRQEIADDLHWSLQKVDRMKAALVDVGALRIRARHNDRGHDWNEYRVEDRPPGGPQI